MAYSIKETEKSRNGSTIGASLALPRTFYVQVETQGEDPVRLLQFGYGTRRGAGLGGDDSHPGIPVGSSHPWNRHALAETYSLQDRIGVYGFIIRVDYRLPQSTVTRDDFSGAWNMSFRAASIPRRLLQEINNSELTDASDPNYATGRIIGANKYRQVDPDADPPEVGGYRATISGNNIVELIQLEAREQTGADAPIPAASMVLRKTHKNWNVDNVANVIPYKYTVNVNQFFGGGPGHVEFVDWSIDTRIVPDTGVGPNRDGTRVMVTEHTFALSFFYAAIRLDQLPILHTYEPAGGGFVKVVPADDPGLSVEETFATREQKNLDTLLGLFV